MTATTTWRDLRERASTSLAAAGFGNADREAHWMVELLSGYDGAELLLGEDEEAPAVTLAKLDSMIERRCTGEPLQHVLGRWSFLGLELIVDRRVLVPRPETEVVAQIAIEETARLGARRGHKNPWSASITTSPVADLGTGSGAIALALAVELPDVEVWATDVSADALAVARANLAGVGSAATRIRLAEGSWFAALPESLRGALRLVVSNPPYLAEQELGLIDPVVSQWEPREALVSGPTGLEALGAIIAEAPRWLAPDGSVLVCELAPHQAPQMLERARDAGFAKVEIRKDLVGRDRALVARWRHAAE